MQFIKWPFSQRSRRPLAYLVGSVLLSVGLPQCSSTSQVPAIEAGAQYEVSRDYVRFFTGPNASVFDHATRLVNEGQLVDVIAVRDREIEVELGDGTAGFIDASDLREVGGAPIPLRELAVVEAPEVPEAPEESAPEEVAVADEPAPVEEKRGWRRRSKPEVETPAPIAESTGALEVTDASPDAVVAPPQSPRVVEVPRPSSPPILPAPPSEVIAPTIDLPEPTLDSSPYPSSPREAVTPPQPEPSIPVQPAPDVRRGALPADIQLEPIE